MTDRHSHDNPTVHHEESDVNIRAILGFGVAMVVAGIVVHLLVWLLFTFFASREARAVAPAFPLAVGQESRLPPEPRLQSNPRQDLRDLRAHESAVLDSYGWVSKSAGIVHIPIEQAMKLTVQRGLPARSASEGKK